MNVGVLGGLFFILFVSAAVITHQRSKSKFRRRRPKGSSTGLTTAVHLPSDDPHWQAHSKRMSTRKPKRRRAWAAGMAGVVGTGSIDAGGVCSAGSSDAGSGCGGGGCGGGCGGG